MVATVLSLLLSTSRYASQTSDFFVDLFVTSSGGGELTAASYELEGSLGQTIASEVSQDGLTIAGGFWQRGRTNDLLIFSAGIAGGEFRFTSTSEVIKSATVQVSTDLRTWSDVEDVTFVNGAAEFSDLIAPTEAMRFFRLRP